MGGGRGSVRAAGLLDRVHRLFSARKTALAEAEAIVAQRRWHAAERAFDALVERWPDDVDVLSGRARVAARRWDFTLAARLLDRGSAMRPRDPALHVLLGDARRQIGDAEGAIAAFEAALSSGGGQSILRKIAAIEGERANVAAPDRPTVLVSFSTPQFAPAQRRLAASGTAAGRIAATIEWTSERLRATPFYAAHRDVLDIERGAGCWAWKPYIILDAFDAVPDGGYVVYCDSGRGDGYLFRQSVAPLVRWCEATGHGALPGVYIPSYGRNAVWTKRDCFVLMGCDGEAFWNAIPVQATFSVWRRDARNRAFLDRWLACCTQRSIVWEDPSTAGFPELPDFQDHRHDQSVLTNLCVAEGRPAFGRPDERTSLPKDINSIIGRVRDAGF